MDFFLKDKITKIEHDDKRGQLTIRRAKIMQELEGHNSADDNFNQRIIDVLKFCCKCPPNFHSALT